MRDDVELVEGDLGIGQVTRHALDERRRHVDGHRPDRLRVAAAGGEFRRELPDDAGASPLADEHHSPRRSVRHGGDVVVPVVLTTVTHREAGAPVKVDAHRQPARALVEMKTVDIPGLGQAEGRGEELVVHGALPVVAQGRMRHCASFGPTPACSPGCAREGCAPPG